MKTIFSILTMFLVACVPAGQREVQSQAQTQDPIRTSQVLTDPSLLTTVLSISSLQASFPVDEAFLQGQDIPINNGYAKGNLRLLLSMVLPIPESSYLILPLEGNLVLGSGIYLLLLEKQGSSYVQTHDVYLGSGVNLFGLEYADGRITSVTVDPRTGKPPFNPPRGGTQVFQIQNGQLVEANSP